jgi:hypothetical protein
MAYILHDVKLYFDGMIFALLTDWVLGCDNRFVLGFWG